MAQKFSPLQKQISHPSSLHPCKKQISHSSSLLTSYPYSKIHQLSNTIRSCVHSPKMNTLSEVPTPDGWDHPDVQLAVKNLKDADFTPDELADMKSYMRDLQRFDITSAQTSTIVNSRRALLVHVAGIIN